MLLVIPTLYVSNQTSSNMLNDKFETRFVQLILEIVQLEICNRAYIAIIESSKSGCIFGGMVEAARAIPQAKSNSVTVS